MIELVFHSNILKYGTNMKIVPKHWVLSEKTKKWQEDAWCVLTRHLIDLNGPIGDNDVTLGFCETRYYHIYECKAHTKTYIIKTIHD